MSDGILLDTSFLISFADPNQPNHSVAVQYFQYFVDESIPMYLSTIAASEFHLKQPVTDLPLDSIIIMPFNLDDAMHAATLDFTKYKGAPGEKRDVLKDDFKLLGQAKARDIGFIVTEDVKTLYKYCNKLRAQGEINTKVIKLADGFDTSHFDPNGQHDLQGLF
jgi:hypothetical protein